MDITNKGDFISGVIITIFVAYGFYLLRELPTKAAIFPQFTLTGMGVLGLILSIRSVNWRNKGKNKKTDREVAPKPYPKVEAKLLVFLCLVVFGLYILLMPVIGFLISTVLFIFFILFLQGMKRFFLMLIIACLTALLTFLLFRTIMYISLPSGIFDPTEFFYQIFN